MSAKAFNCVGNERDHWLTPPALLEALRGFDAVNGMCALGAVHGMPYTGPSWELEYKSAREALATPAEPPIKPCDGVQLVYTFVPWLRHRLPRETL